MNFSGIWQNCLFPTLQTYVGMQSGQFGPNYNPFSLQAFVFDNEPVAVNRSSDAGYGAMPESHTAALASHAMKTSSFFEMRLHGFAEYDVRSMRQYGLCRGRLSARELDTSFPSAGTATIQRTWRRRSTS